MIYVDDPSCTWQSKVLQDLNVCGRHNMFSTITATQLVNDIHPSIRVNATDNYIFISEDIIMMWKML